MQQPPGRKPAYPSACFEISPRGWRDGFERQGKAAYGTVEQELQRAVAMAPGPHARGPCPFRAGPRRSGGGNGANAGASGDRQQRPALAARLGQLRRPLGLDQAADGSPGTQPGAARPNLQAPRCWCPACLHCWSSPSATWSVVPVLWPRQAWPGPGGSHGRSFLPMAPGRPGGCALPASACPCRGHRLVEPGQPAPADRTRRPPALHRQVQRPDFLRPDPGSLGRTSPVPRCQPGSGARSRPQLARRPPAAEVAASA